MLLKLTGFVSLGKTHNIQDLRVIARWLGPDLGDDCSWGTRLMLKKDNKSSPFNRFWMLAAQSIIYRTRLSVDVVLTPSPASDWLQHLE